jgi:hypothetical protein
MAARVDEAWKRIIPVGGCQCSDGSEFSFWVREASPKTVAFSLQDGGARFSAETCAPHGDLYNISIGSDDGTGPPTAPSAPPPPASATSTNPRRFVGDWKPEKLRHSPILSRTRSASSCRDIPTRLR